MNHDSKKIDFGFDLIYYSSISVSICAYIVFISDTSWSSIRYKGQKTKNLIKKYQIINFIAKINIFIQDMSIF